MAMDRLAGFGPTSSSTEPRSRRLLTRALSRPSLPALVALVVVLLVFAVRDRAN